MNVIENDWVKASERLPMQTNGYAEMIEVKWIFSDGEQVRNVTINQFLDIIKFSWDKEKIEWRKINTTSPTKK